ncbi:MAG: DUF3788 family protein [Phycisphaerales bacterium JB038]
MALSAFDDKGHEPSRAEVAAVLGRAAGAWGGLVEFVDAEFPPLEQSWQFSGAKWGWSLRLIQKKRVVVYLTPQQGFFYAGFALGEKAVQAAHQARLAATVLEIIDHAPKYAEGRGFRMEIRNRKQVASLKRLITIRMSI